MMNLTGGHGNQGFDLNKLHVSQVIIVALSHLLSPLLLVVQIQIGSLVDLYQGDQIDVFHVLRPGIRVRGVVKESYPISCSVMIKLDEERKKLQNVLAEVYKASLLGMDSRNILQVFCHSFCQKFNQNI